MDRQHDRRRESQSPNLDGTLFSTLNIYCALFVSEPEGVIMIPTRLIRKTLVHTMPSA